MCPAEPVNIAIRTGTPEALNALELDAAPTDVGCLLKRGGSDDSSYVNK